MCCGGFHHNEHFIVYGMKMKKNIFLHESYIGFQYSDMHVENDKHMYMVMFLVTDDSLPRYNYIISLWSKFNNCSIYVQDDRFRIVANDESTVAKGITMSTLFQNRIYDESEVYMLRKIDSMVHDFIDEDFRLLHVMFFMV